MALESFDALYQRAAERKGGELKLNALLADDKPIFPSEDDRILSAFTKKVFQSGFVWRVVENKWPDPSNEPIEGMVFQSAEKSVALSMYIVPAQPPNRFFSHCAEINQPVADPAHQKVRLKNTLIGLVEL
jgi:hypothetical protein